MHMADALLSPAIGGGFWLGSFGVLAYAANKLKKHIDERLIPLMGVLGAFVFAAQMINFTIPGTGSSGHIGGGMLLAIILGPHAAFIVIASVLTVQALLFADGGVLALGCNIWNLGVYPSFVAYPLIYRGIVKNNPTKKRTGAASILSAVAALQLGAFSVTLQTKLSGITDIPFTSFLAFMQLIHLAIGTVEGFITMGVVDYIKRLRPEVVYTGKALKREGVYIKKVIIAIALLSIFTGGVLSWFASTYPDGLEWALAKVHWGEEPKGPAGPLGERTTMQPEHALPPASGKEDGGTPARRTLLDAEISLSGLIGGLTVFGAVVLFGIGVKYARGGRYNGNDPRDPDREETGCGVRMNTPEDRG